MDVRLLLLAVSILAGKRKACGGAGADGRMHARVLSPDAGQGHGAGAEHIMRAEACFLRGDDAGAETLCHRAFFAADTRRQNSIYLCGLFLLYLTGMMDDLIGVRYRSKFLIQILCGILLVASGLCFDNLYGLFGIEAMPYYIGAPFTVFIIVYILNAINLIDGIDGLASGLSIIAFFAFGCMFIRLQWWMYAFICLATIGVLLPFFYYNVYGNVHRGRKIFMGDTGSLTIGMLLAVMAIRLSMSDPLKESTFPGAVVIAFSFLIVPMLDVVRVVLHRWRERKPLFLPDRNHIHHKFIALGLSQRQAMACIIGIALSFAVVNVFLIHCLSTTILFLLDVAVWTVLHCYITVRINRKNKLEKNCTENKI